MFTGVDVSKKKLDVFIRPIGTRFTVTNDEAGHRELVERCPKGKEALVVFESTGAYERDAARTMMEAGFDVAVVNPARVREFAKSLGKLAKTDGIDSEVIAHFAEVAKPRLLLKTDDQEEDAKGLLLRRRQLVDMRAQEKTRRLQTRGEVRRNIERHIKWLDEQIDEVDDGLDAYLRERLAEKARLLATIPGFGEVVRKTLLLEMPELGQMTGKEAAALAGLAPFNVDSGMHQGKRRIRGGRVVPRSVLYMAALSLTKGKTIFAEMYQRLIQRGKTPKIAIIAICRKMVVIANGVLRSGTPWRGGVASA